MDHIREFANGIHHVPDSSAAAKMIDARSAVRHGVSSASCLDAPGQKCTKKKGTASTLLSIWGHLDAIATLADIDCTSVARSLSAAIAADRGLLK
jgi:hypothetical protein